MERNGGRVSVPYAALLYDPEGKTYVYTMHATGPLADTQLVAGLPTTLPKAVLLNLAKLLPPAAQQGLADGADLVDPAQHDLAESGRFGGEQIGAMERRPRRNPRVGRW